MSSTNAVTKTKNPFTFNKEFKREFDCAMKVYDETFSEFHKVTSSTTVDIPDEYGVCNNNYKLRFITPTNISSFISYIMKALKNQMIKPNIGDMEKFAVATAKQFIADNGCVPMEDSSIYATGDYSSDHMTLKDLLLLCENDVYHTGVCSKYDMTQRKASMKNDVSKIVDMHYGANMKKIVNALPALFEKTDFGDMEYSERELITTYVETFILFATTLNCVTMSNMILYCVPKSTYNTHAIEKKENDIKYNSLVNGDYYNESVDTRKNKPILVVLMQGNSWYSGPIKSFTKSKFSHSAICFGNNMETAYTFKRGENFTTENLKSEEFDNIPAKVFAVYVTNEQYSDMKHLLDTFKNHQSDTKYDFSIIKNIFLKNDVENDKPFNQVCSTFVDALFKATNINLTGKNLPTPADFDTKMSIRPSQCHQIYEGKLGESLIGVNIGKSLQKFAHSADSSTVDSIVTECCLLKTNNMMLHNKIPFNINMRDIVLQDMHPNFKDTKSALHFILKDSRSPISQLLIKYGDEKKCRYMDPMVVINLFAHDTRCRFDCDRDFLACQYDRTDFHTDVNWLDKIAYGNNYLNGNYRNDGVGNHNFTSMTTTLDTLYRMFGDCALNSSEELANHIMVIADLMNTVIRAYSECHIKNWDLVRDVLAVLGEIITRCMIKLYNNHMTVFVATDNMNDTDIPGYMYTESFVMEADDTKPKVENDSGATGVKSALQKAQTVITQLLHRFIAWVGEKLTKFNVKFFENHKIEFQWVEKNNKLNGEIETALRNKTFTPTVTNYPNYNIPADALIKEPISKIVNDLLTVNTKAPITPENIKARFYPDAVSAALGYKKVDTSDTAAADTQAAKSSTPPAVNGDTNNGEKVEESYVMRSYGSYMMEANENNDKTSKSNEREQEVLTNYILYGDVNHQPTSGQTRLDDKQWHSLYMDILQTNKLFDKSIQPIYADLDKTLTDIKKRKDAVKAKLDSFNNNNGEQAKQDNEEKAKAEQESQRLDSMVKALQDIANSYDALLANVLSQKFYRTSYTLYRDIVTAYNQQKSVDKSNSKQTTESFVDAIEGIGEIIV